MEPGRRTWTVAESRDVIATAFVLLAFYQVVQGLVPFVDPVYRAFVVGSGFRDPPSILDLAFFTAGALALAGTPFIARGLAPATRSRLGLAALAGAAGVARASMGLASTGRLLYASVVATGVLVLVLLPALLDRARARGVPGVVGPALLLAFLLESGLRVLGASIDVSVSAHTPAWSVLAGAAVAAVALLPADGAREARPFAPASGSGHRALLVGVGLFLAVHLLAQAAPLARWTGVPYTAAAVAVFGGILAGGAVHLSRPARERFAWPLAFAPLAAVLGLLLPDALAPVKLALAAVALAAVADALAGAFTAEARRTGGRVPRFWVAALLAFLLFAWAAVRPFARAPDYRPFGEWIVLGLLAAAAVLFVPGALLGRETRTRPHAPPRVTRAAAAVLALAVLAPALAFPVGAALDASGAVEPDATARTIRVVSFNAHHGVGPHGIVDWLTIADALADMDADVIALQEVEGGRASRGSVDALVVLRRELGVDGVFAPTIANAYGNAVVTRHPLVDGETILLPSAEEQRGAARARILLPGGVEADVYSIHLAFSAEERVGQGAELADRVRDGGVTAFVAGDFNPWGFDAASEALESIGMHKSQALAGPSPPPTFTVRNPRAAIDFVYATPDVEFLSHTVRHDVRVSDHFPVVAVASLPRGEG